MNFLIKYRAKIQTLILISSENSTILFFYSSHYGLTNVKALAYSIQKGSLFVVAGHDSQPYEGSLFIMDGFGTVEDRLKAARLSWLSDITVLADGTILACEPKERKVRQINNGQIFRDKTSGHLMVPWHETDEVYIFSSTGDHLETRSLFSDAFLLGFTYDSQGNLQRVFNKKQEVLRIEQKIQGDYLLINDQHVATLMIGESNCITSSPSGR